MTYQDIDMTRRVLDDLFGPTEQREFAVRFWDGTVDAGRRGGATRFTLVLRHAGALRRMLLPPSELSIIESYLFGDMDVEGDLEAAAALGDAIARALRGVGALARLALHVAALPRGSRHEHAEVRRARLLGRYGRKHSATRDERAVRFHYDVGNDFYALWLDRRMVYSCAYFARSTDDLDAAQEAKLDYACRKLRLQPDERFLDVGCGWGALIIHAAEHYGVDATGITLSERQAALARERIASAGLSERCRVEVRDYRTLREGAGAFDKAASIGMVEHVGERRLPKYFASVFHALRAGGLFLNHGIVGIAAARPESIASWIAGRVWRRNVFIERYVFPDGVLVPAARVIAAAERVGFELRDVESLREHYTKTLRHWVRRLEQHQRRVVELVGDVTYRVWRLYMATSAYGFNTGRIGVIQSLLAKRDAGGAARLPSTREDLYEDQYRH